MAQFYYPYTSLLEIGNYLQISILNVLQLEMPSGWNVSLIIISYMEKSENQ